MWPQGINITDTLQCNGVRNKRFAGYSDYARTFLLSLRARL